MQHGGSDWRKAQDVPRGRILRDEALYDIANQAPTSTDQLSELRTLSEGFSRSSRAKEIIEAVKKGLARDPKSLPPLNHGNQLSAEATATLELLKVLLKANAARHKVAPRLIADTDDLERIASDGAGRRSRAQGVAAAIVRRGRPEAEARRVGLDAAQGRGRRGSRRQRGMNRD